MHIIKNFKQGLLTQILTDIHNYNKANGKVGAAPPYFDVIFCLLRRIIVPYIGFIILIFSFIGCGVTSQSIDVIYNSAYSQLNKAREVGAEQFASEEFYEAQNILTKIKSNNDNKEKKSTSAKGACSCSLC